MKCTIARQSEQQCAWQQLLEGKETKQRVEEHMKLKVLLVLIGLVQIAQCSVGKWRVK